MTRPIVKHVLLSSLLLAATATAASAQGPEPARDTLATRVDSVQQAGHGWLVSLLKKIARRSDDSLATTVDSTAEEDSKPEVAPAPTKRVARVFKSRRDSLDWESARAAAERADGFRIVVDIFAHQLYVINNEDTLRTAPVATAMNATLSYGGRSWRFETPRGVRRVLYKDKDPVWVPPEWHFAEVALEHHLKLRTIERGQVIRLRDGSKLMVQGDEVGVIDPGSKEFVPMVLDEHIVFDNTLFIPPVGTKHRSVEGELGHFRLALGDGYQLHGTPYANSIGSAVTHGCVRLRDEDIEWLYDNVPVGTRVFLY